MKSVWGGEDGWIMRMILLEAIYCMGWRTHSDLGTPSCKLFLNYTALHKQVVRIYMEKGNMRSREPYRITDDVISNAKTSV